MLKGNLADFPLLGLLQMLLSSGRGGALVIEPPPLASSIYIYAGQIVHAQAGPLTGSRALTLIAGIRRAAFRFDAEGAPPMATIETGGFQTQARLAEEVQTWQSLGALPEDWGQVIKLRSSPQESQLSLSELRLMGEVEGRTVVDVLANSELGVLATAQALDNLFAQGMLEGKPRLSIEPTQLVVLPLYGNEQGVAYIDENLYLQWSRQIKQGFYIRLWPKKGAEDMTFIPRPRPNFQSRVGLFEKDLRKYRLARGTQVEVWPELS